MYTWNVRKPTLLHWYFASSSLPMFGNQMYSTIQANPTVSNNASKINSQVSKFPIDSHPPKRKLGQAKSTLLFLRLHPGRAKVIHRFLVEPFPYVRFFSRFVWRHGRRNFFNFFHHIIMHITQWVLFKWNKEKGQEGGNGKWMMLLMETLSEYDIMRELCTTLIKLKIQNIFSDVIFKTLTWRILLRKDENKGKNWKWHAFCLDDINQPNNLNIKIDLFVKGWVLFCSVLELFVYLGILGKSVLISTSCSISKTPSMSPIFISPSYR